MFSENRYFILLDHYVNVGFLSNHLFQSKKETKNFSSNLTSLISDHTPQLLILKDFHRKSAVTNNIYDRNYWFFNDNEFKNDLKSNPWENILSQANLPASSAFDLFSKQVNTLLDEHAPIHKLLKKELPLKKKLWISKSIQSLMRERDRLFKCYWQKTNSKVKLTNHNDYKRIRNTVVSKIKESKKQYSEIFFQRNSKNLKKT